MFNSLKKNSKKTSSLSCRSRGGGVVVCGGEEVGNPTYIDCTSDIQKKKIFFFFCFCFCFCFYFIFLVWVWVWLWGGFGGGGGAGLVA